MKLSWNFQRGWGDDDDDDDDDNDDDDDDDYNHTPRPFWIASYAFATG